MGKYTQESYSGDSDQHKDRSLKQRLFIIIFGTDTKAGRIFDIVLLILIALSVLAVMLETMPSVSKVYGDLLRATEWVLTIAFTIEYFGRIWVVKYPRRYIFSFFGIIDFLAVIPTYLSLFIIGSQTIAILRVIRLLRIFRVLSMSKYLSEGALLLTSLRKSKHRIIVFFLGVLVIVVLVGSAMYIIEGPENGFHSIPLSIYWAIVTLTTVGFGDIYPQSMSGRMLAAFLMLLGYSVIAIPSGIVGAELYAEVNAKKNEPEALKCPECGEQQHFPNAAHCHRCGNPMT